LSIIGSRRKNPLKRAGGLGTRQQAVRGNPAGSGGQVGVYHKNDTHMVWAARRFWADGAGAPGQGSQAELHRARADGEPQRARGGGGIDAGRWLRRAPSGSADDRASVAGAQRITVGADKGYDTADFIADLRQLDVTPHVAQNVKGGAPRSTDEPRGMPAMPSASRSESEGGAVRLGQDDRRPARPMLRAARKLRFKFTLTMASYNPIRISKLLEGSA
jgi:hypothetical protein